jgi:hypothetical protein
VFLVGFVLGGTFAINGDNREVRHPGNQREAQVIRDLLAETSLGAARS